MRIIRVLALSLVALSATGAAHAVVSWTGVYIGVYSSNSISRYSFNGSLDGTFASGGGLSGPYGSTIGPDGNLYVASSGTDEIKKYEKATGNYLGNFVAAGLGGLDDPRDLVFMPDGQLLVTSAGTNDVKKFDRNGLNPTSFANGANLSSPAGMAWGPNGDLYVASSGNDRIVRYNGKTGAFKQAIVNALIDGPAGLEWGVDGNLYVACFNNDTVARYNPNSESWSTFATGVNDPWGLAFGPDGNLYVGSYTDNLIKRFNRMTGAFMDDWASVTSPTDFFFAPRRETDLSGDNLPDVLLWNIFNSAPAPNLAIASLQGLRFVNSYGLDLRLGANWRPAATADFNDDSFNDIVIQNTSDRRISVLRTQGRRIIASTRVGPTTLPDNWDVAAAADFDGDGDPDLLVENISTWRLAVLRMDGTNIVQSRSLINNQLNPEEYVVGSGDFDGDKDHDLVVQNRNTRQIYILTLQNMAVMSRTDVTTIPPSNWYIGAVGDFNGDGWPDFMLQNISSSNLSRFIVQGMQVVDQDSVLPKPGFGWYLFGPK